MFPALELFASWRRSGLTTFCRTLNISYYWRKTTSCFKGFVLPLHMDLYLRHPVIRWLQSSVPVSLLEAESIPDHAYQVLRRRQTWSDTMPMKTHSQTGGRYMRSILGYIYYQCQNRQPCLRRTWDEGNEKRFWRCHQLSTTYGVDYHFKIVHFH